LALHLLKWKVSCRHFRSDPPDWLENVKGGQPIRSGIEINDRDPGVSLEEDKRL
jgi:hypothetical protein